MTIRVETAQGGRGKKISRREHDEAELKLIAEYREELAEMWEGREDFGYNSEVDVGCNSDGMGKGFGVSDEEESDGSTRERRLKGNRDGSFVSDCDNVAEIGSDCDNVDEIGFDCSNVAEKSATSTHQLLRGGMGAHGCKTRLLG